MTAPEDDILNEGRGTVLYTSNNCHYCHRVRLVLLKKGLPCEIIECDGDELPPEVLPHVHADPDTGRQAPPVLKDKDVALSLPGVILEYLDERYPYPPLMPIMPVDRARRRTQLQQMDLEWSPLVDKLARPGHSKTDVLRRRRKELRDKILALAPAFEESLYFMGEEETLADVYILPILWRLPSLGVEIERTRETRGLLEYEERSFDTAHFRKSLTPREMGLRR